MKRKNMRTMIGGIVGLIGSIPLSLYYTSRPAQALFSFIRITSGILLSYSLDGYCSKKRVKKLKKRCKDMPPKKVSNRLCLFIIIFAAIPIVLSICFDGSAYANIMRYIFESTYGILLSALFSLSDKLESAGKSKSKKKKKKRRST